MAVTLLVPEPLDPSPAAAPFVLELPLPVVVVEPVAVGEPVPVGKPVAVVVPVPVPLVSTCSPP